METNREHIAAELDYQVGQVWKRISDLPPTGGLGWATLKFEELADVAARASAALRTNALDRPAA